jgi:hypothetical protein
MRRLNQRLNRYLPSTKVLLLCFLLLDVIQFAYFISAAERGKIHWEIKIEAHHHYYPWKETEWKRGR